MVASNLGRAGHVVGATAGLGGGATALLSLPLPQPTTPGLPHVMIARRRRAKPIVSRM
jgi:hypothetical protein